LVEKDGVKSESKDINFHDNKPINLLLKEEYSLIYKEDANESTCGFGIEALDWDPEFREYLHASHSAF